MEVFSEHFVMQAYTFVSGYLSIPTVNERRIFAAWKSVIVTYVISMTIYLAYIRIVFRTGTSITYFTNMFTTKFNFLASTGTLGPSTDLFTLIWWRILVPVLMQLRFPLAVAVFALQTGYASYPETNFADGTFLR